MAPLLDATWLGGDGTTTAFSHQPLSSLLLPSSFTDSLRVSMLGFSSTLMRLWNWPRWAVARTARGPGRLVFSTVTPRFLSDPLRRYACVFLSFHFFFLRFLSLRMTLRGIGMCFNTRNGRFDRRRSPIRFGSAV